MTESNGILEKTGVVQAIGNPGTAAGKPKYGVKLEDGWYDGFGVLPEGIIKGSTVKVKYRLKGQYHNIIDGGIELMSNSQSVDKPTPDKRCQTIVEDFKSSNNIDDLVDLVDGTAILWNKCFEAIHKILEHKPSTDGELAAVNSLFIEANKRIVRGNL